MRLRMSSSISRAMWGNERLRCGNAGNYSYSFLLNVDLLYFGAAQTWNFWVFGCTERNVTGTDTSGIPPFLITKIRVLRKKRPLLLIATVSDRLVSTMLQSEQKNHITGDISFCLRLDCWWTVNNRDLGVADCCWNKKSHATWFWQMTRSTHQQIHMLPLHKTFVAIWQLKMESN